MRPLQKAFRTESGFESNFSARVLACDGPRGVTAACDSLRALPVVKLVVLEILNFSLCLQGDT